MDIFVNKVRRSFLTIMFTTIILYTLTRTYMFVFRVFAIEKCTITAINVKLPIYV